MQAKVIGGFFMSIQPWAIVTDLEFAKIVLIKDSEYFLDRGFYVNEQDDPLTANLINIADEKWKILRKKFSPIFTSEKIKNMIPIMVGISNKLIKCIDRAFLESIDINLSDYLSCFTIDIIGSCAFGIDCDTVNNPESKFLQIAKKVFSISSVRTAKLFFLCGFRSLAKSLHMRWTLREVEAFYTNLVTEVIEYRERENVKRNDFLDLMLQLKNRGKLDNEAENETGVVTLNEIIANVQTFLLAGYDTSSATIKFCLLELAHHQNIQDCLRNELRSVMDQFREITYEKLGEMIYLNKVVYETLRKHPPFGVISRTLSKDYKVLNMDLSLQKGTMVLISVLGFHHDPQIYPEPENFDPERFSSQAIKSRHPYAFLGFGNGPRNCIGMRFALMQIKICLATLLLMYKVSPCSRTQYPIEYSKSSMVLTPKEGCWLRIEKC
ncbi:cytochrome P450 6A1-like [Lutzomyia longipalpis]|uniref:cytochrome P450 6A1-like n=1 Tax=Lutzomyia longipalpis TaxID=7200 RepID=UPI002483C719|nr:cytochrome P450 6A1-like [Lutzomyia longipalpis]